jgi:ATP synthase protein I
MSADETGEAPGGGEDPRLASLEERLEEAHRIEAKRTAPTEVRNIFTGKGVSQGNRVLSVLIGVPLGSFFIGFAIDQLFGTRPWAMLTMLFLGTISAFVQIWRISKERAQ